MIDDEQYIVSSAQLAKLKEALAAAETMAAVLAAEIEELRGQITDIEAAVRERDRFRW